MRFPQIALLARPRPREVAGLSRIASVLRSRGYRVREAYDLAAPEPVVFSWSWGKAMIQRQKFPNAIICCIDHGYTPDRGSLFNTGWSVPSMACGLNGFAEHPWVDDGGARLEAHGWDRYLEPRRPATALKRALLLGQVYGDAMIITQTEDYGAWLRKTRDGLEQDGYSVTFRPHPVMVRRGTAGQYGNVGRLTANRDLRGDLAEADLAVALNSNGLVEAYLAGVQVEWWNKGTMLAPLGGVGEPMPFDERRREWLNRLAFTQWYEEELGDPDKWIKHHEPIMHRLVETGECRPWHTQSV